MVSFVFHFTLLTFLYIRDPDGMGAKVLVLPTVAVVLHLGRGKYQNVKAQVYLN